MKTLLLDVGNSRLKWALADGDLMQPGRALAHGGEPAAAIVQIAANAVDSIWIANVTGAAHGAALAAALRVRYGVAANFPVTEAHRLGLLTAYAEPQRMGVDRWLALLAAWVRTRGAVCVASCGTALTFDVVDAEGQHLGGVIAPGLRIMQQAVLGATRIEASGLDLAYSDGLGANTEACIRQGALHACAGLVDRLAVRQNNAARFLTGGDAYALRPHLAKAWIAAPDLVLEGLLVLARDSVTG